MDSSSKKLKVSEIESKDEVPNKSDSNVSQSLQMYHDLQLVQKQPETLANDFQNLSVTPRGHPAQERVDWREACDQPALWQHVEFEVHLDRSIPLAILIKHQIQKFLINARNSPVSTSSHLRSLCGNMPKIQSLRCYGCHKMTDAIFRTVLPPLGLPYMTHLDMSSSSLTDDSIDLITQSMPNLAFLQLSLWLSVTDKALLFIAQRLRKLETLDFADCPKFTQKGYGYLVGKINDEDAAIPQNHDTKVASNSPGAPDVANQGGPGSSIVTLNASCYQLEDDCLHELSHMANLRQLKISCCTEVSDTGLAYLSTMVNLQALEVSGSDNVSDAGLLHVAKMPGLRSLTLNECHRITTAGLRQLGQQGSGITSLDVSHCGRLRRNTLYEIAVGLLHLRCLRIDRIDTTLEGYRMAASNLLNLEAFFVDGLDELGSLLTMRRRCPTAGS